MAFFLFRPPPNEVLNANLAFSIPFHTLPVHFIYTLTAL